MSDRHDKPDPDDEDPTISSLYRRARREKPRPEVDAAILAASRREVKSGPRTAGPFSGRWTVPVSMAAVLMISIILVPLLRQESGKLPEGPDSRPDHPAPASAGPASKDRETVEPVIELNADMVMPPRAAEVASPPAARSRRDMPIEATPQYKLQESPPPALRYQAMPREEFLADDSPPAARQLKEIERLIETGETARARAMLKGFVARYPEYPIAPEIRTLLEN